LAEDVEQAQSAAEAKTDRQRQIKAMTGWLALGAGGGALLVGAVLLIGALARPVVRPALSETTQAQLAAIAVTLDPVQAPDMVQRAQSCQVPLGHVAIWHDPGVSDAPVRVRSGGYTSPSFMLTSTPQVIALPYPAPYATGAGTLTILGSSKGVEMALTPTTAFANVAGAASVNVVWDTGNPCQ
jgi:hypothetical protein